MNTPLLVSTWLISSLLGLLVLAAWQPWEACPSPARSDPCAVTHQIFFSLLPSLLLLFPVVPSAPIHRDYLLCIQFSRTCRSLYHIIYTNFQLWGPHVRVFFSATAPFHPRSLSLGRLPPSLSLSSSLTPFLALLLPRWMQRQPLLCGASPLWRTPRAVPPFLWHLCVPGGLLRWPRAGRRS